MRNTGEDRYPWAREKTRVDADVRQEYWTQIRDQPERAEDEFA